MANMLLFSSLGVPVCRHGKNTMDAADPAGTWQEFVALMTSSKLCAVSAFDLTILFGFIINLTAKDYQLRKPDATAEEALKIAALTGLWPYVGSAIYMVLRPSLPDEA